MKYFLSLITIAVWAFNISAVPRTATLPKPTGKGLRLDVNTGNIYHIVRPGNLKGVEVVVTNTTDRPVSIELKLGIRYRTTEPVRVAAFAKVNIPAKGTYRKALPTSLVGTRLGMRYLDWQGTGKDAFGSGVVPFAVMAPVGATPGQDTSGDGFVFGIAGGMRFYRDSQWKKEFFKAAGMIGCEAYRIDMSWTALNPKPGVWKFEGLDECVAMAQEQGMFIQPLIGYGNPWALKPKYRKLLKTPEQKRNAWKYPVVQKHWAEFNKKIASRYTTSQMQYYEIWNEADIGFWPGTAEEYIETLKTSYETLKAVNPKIIVTTSGFASSNHHAFNRKLVEMTFGPGSKYYDWVAWHRHGDFDGFQAEVDKYLLPNMKKFGLEKRKITFNETAVGKSFEQEWELATNLVKKLVFCWGRGARAHYWYNLSKSHPAYVMMNDGWTPRPSYPAYNEVARQLRGRKLVKRLDVGAGRWAFMLNGKGTFTGTSNADHTIVAWTEDVQLGAKPLTIHAGASASKAYEVDVMGNRTALPLHQGLVFASIEKEPKYIVIEGCAATPRIGKGIVADTGGLLLLAPGSKKTVELELCNPFPAAIEFKLSAKAKDGIAAAFADDTYTLAPQATRKIPLTVTFGNNAQALTSEIAVNVDVKGGPHLVQATIPLAIPRVMQRGAVDAAKPMFVMQGSRHVVNTNDIDPSLSQYMWKGNGDLSAKAWVVAHRDHLEIVVDVKDDKHNNTEHFSTAHKADSVEIGMTWPGLEGWLNFVMWRENKGGSRVHFRRQPSVFKGRKLWSKVKLTTTPGKGTMRYSGKAYFKDLDLSEAILRKGIRFNIMVHDKDGAKYDGFTRLSQAIGNGAEPGRFPILILR